MAERTTIVPGRALRLYQVAGILLLGWMAGRLPDLLSQKPAASRAGAGAAEAGALAAGDAAALAAAVASQVASETVARLVAAGWGPEGRQTSPAPSAPSSPAVLQPVILPIEQAPPPPSRKDPVAGYVLPPMGVTPVNGKPDAERAAAPSARPDMAPPTAPARQPQAPLKDRKAEAHARASRGYERLQAGDRRGAAQDLAAALAIAPEAAEAEAWKRDLRLLTRHVSASMFALFRTGSGGDPLSASPILGGTQTGAVMGYTLNPLDRRRVTLFGRLSTGADVSGALDPDTSEAAIGVRADPFPRLPIHVAIERRFALGMFAVDGWAARIAGGAAGTARLGRVPINWDVYGEGGLVDVQDPMPYAGLQARGVAPILSAGRIHLDGGAGFWGAGQEGFTASHRIDLGPTLRMRVDRLPIGVQLDYRFKVFGNAEPSSGVALTLTGDF
ncbi:hypothetical protein [Thermaurantiacus sp.]